MGSFGNIECRVWAADWESGLLVKREYKSAVSTQERMFAAIEAFYGSGHVEAWMLEPHGLLMPVRASPDGACRRRV